MPDISDKDQVAKVVIFGEEYTVRSSDDTEYVLNVAEYVDKKMREIAAKNNSMSPNKIAILTALNLTGELFDLKRKSGEDLSEVDSRAKNIIEMLDKKLSLDKIG